MTPPARQGAHPGIDAAVRIQDIRSDTAQDANQAQAITELGRFCKAQRLRFQARPGRFPSQTALGRCDDDQTVAAVAHPERFVQNPDALPP
jgi:hypothetical protein